MMLNVRSKCFAIKKYLYSDLFIQSVRNGNIKYGADGKTKASVLRVQCLRRKCAMNKKYKVRSEEKKFRLSARDKTSGRKVCKIFKWIGNVECISEERMNEKCPNRLSRVDKIQAALVLCGFPQSEIWTLQGHRT